MSVRSEIKYGDDIIIPEYEESASSVLVKYNNQNIVDIQPGEEILLTTQNQKSIDDIICGQKILKTKNTYLTKNITIHVKPSRSDMLPLGGQIFYIEERDNGAEYFFFDGNEKIIRDQSYSALQNAVYYIKRGTSNFDKFYVSCPHQLYTYTTLLSWSQNIFYEVTAEEVGTGKSNTQTMITNTVGISGLIWGRLLDLREANVGGCNDWFIPSVNELDLIRRTMHHGTVFNYSVYSSTEYNNNSCYGYHDDSEKIILSKFTPGQVDSRAIIIARSF